MTMAAIGALTLPKTTSKSFSIYGAQIRPPSGNGDVEPCRCRPARPACTFRSTATPRPTPAGNGLGADAARGLNAHRPAAVP